MCTAGVRAAPEHAGPHPPLRPLQPEQAGVHHQRRRAQWEQPAHDAAQRWGDIVITRVPLFRHQYHIKLLDILRKKDTATIHNS